MYPPVLRDVLRSYTKLIVHLDPVWVLEYFPWCSGDSSDTDSLLKKGSHFVIFFFCRGFVVTSFFLVLLSLSFAWTVSFCDYSQRDAPVFFLSLLHRFWLNGLLFWEIMTVCLDDYREPSPSFVSEGCLWCHSLCMK